MKTLILEQISEDITLVKLNRPEALNAIDDDMVRELHEVCALLEREPKILIITGTEVNGKGIFVSGADVGQLRERRREDALRGINNSIFHRISQLPMPVVAAVDGYALGGGLELALAADFRIVTGRARLGQPEASLGILAAAGAMWRLKAAVGETVAREMLMAGRTLSADEALDHNLVSRVVAPEDLMDAAVTIAQSIGRLDPLAVRLSKQLLAMPASAHPAVDNIAQAITFESEGKFDRMQAFLDRKKARKEAAGAPTAAAVGTMNDKENSNV